MKEIILITIGGQDRPGVTFKLTDVLSRYDVTVLDVGQAVIHNTLSLGLLVEMPEDASGCPVFKELLFIAHELNLSIRFNPISEDEYEAWVAAQGKPRHLVTLLGRVISSRHLARVAEVVTQQSCNIDRITRLSGRISLVNPEENRSASVQLWLSGDVVDVAAMHTAFLEVSQDMELDIAIQEDDIYRRSRRLVCFDMDSTLIQTEVIDELAAKAGVGAQVAEITEAAMRGEIDFSESFRRRMALLKGVDESVLQDIADNLPITEGAERLIKSLRSLGYRVAILSGGFTYFANHLKEKLGIDYVHANQLDFNDGKLTGEVKGEIIDGQAKARILRELAAKEGVCLEQVIAVGDGANDLPMLSIAGLGVAFHAKPIVKEQAKHTIATLGLDAIFYLLGMRERDIQQIEELN